MNSTVHGSEACGSAGKESACNAGDLSSIPGLGRSPGEGKGYSLQYSGLENSIDCIVQGVAKIWTQLNNFHLSLRSLSHTNWLYNFCSSEFWYGVNGLKLRVWQGNFLEVSLPFPASKGCLHSLASSFKPEIVGWLLLMLPSLWFSEIWRGSSILMWLDFNVIKLGTSG